MRVIAGKARRLLLKTIEGQDTRPTTDRIKETLFNILNPDLPGSTFLDLFSGSGGIGIEALSRGARELVAVESSRPAAALITKTLAQLQKNRSWDASLKARVLVKKAEQVAGGFGEPFDVIFIDPPYAYETAECNQLLSDLAAGSATNENTVIMLERSVRSDDPTAPGGWQITESRNYGETAVFYIESADDDSDIERSDDSAA